MKIIEDFESDQLILPFSGSWTKSTEQKYSGNCSYCNNNTNGNSTSFSMDCNYISFYYKILSSVVPELDCYIDGKKTLIREVHDWTFLEQQLDYGTHTFTFSARNNSGHSYIGNIVYIDMVTIYTYKYLIKQNSQYYSIKDNMLKLLGLPTDDAQKEQWFNDYGVASLKKSLLTTDENNIRLIEKLDDNFEVRMI
ncbi:hypothetical protein [Clostridium tyrobutyricum]|uniref:hypothetical protein n=1 Tax=Clostridium tyrobutyricum TaxID=1519 RepID=UPI001C3868A6|nr:hypothetical protein [Clostridium tyrobutyricum]MBV4417285.1 hypothetical protein [Clostridium tyrobutyricum]